MTRVFWSILLILLPVAWGPTFSVVGMVQNFNYNWDTPWKRNYDSASRFRRGRPILRKSRSSNLDRDPSQEFNAALSETNSQGGVNLNTHSNGQQYPNPSGQVNEQGVNHEGHIHRAHDVRELEGSAYQHYQDAKIDVDKVEPETVTTHRYSFADYNKLFPHLNYKSKESESGVDWLFGKGPESQQSQLEDTVPQQQQQRENPPPQVQYENLHHNHNQYNQPSHPHQHPHHTPVFRDSHPPDHVYEPPPAQPQGRSYEPIYPNNVRNPDPVVQLYGERESGMRQNYPAYPAYRSNPIRGPQPQEPIGPRQPYHVIGVPPQPQYNRVGNLGENRHARTTTTNRYRRHGSVHHHQQQNHNSNPSNSVLPPEMNVRSESADGHKLSIDSYPVDYPMRDSNGNGREYPYPENPGSYVPADNDGTYLANTAQNHQIDPHENERKGDTIGQKFYSVVGKAEKLFSPVSSSPPPSSFFSSLLPVFLFTLHLY